MCGKNRWKKGIKEVSLELIEIFPQKPCARLKPMADHYLRSVLIILDKINFDLD